MKYRAVATMCVALLVSGCGQWVDGEVIGVTPPVKFGCLNGLPTATIQTDDGRTFNKCMNAPVGARVGICPSDWCNGPRIDQARKLEAAGDEP